MNYVKAYAFCSSSPMVEETIMLVNLKQLTDSHCL